MTISISIHKSCQKKKIHS